MKHSIDELLQRATSDLSLVAQNLSLKPKMESEILLGFVLDVPRIYLHTHGAQIIESTLATHFLSLVSRRKNGMPIEYLTQKASFYGFDFFVNPSVLIPRPESEILIDKARELIHKHNITSIAEIGIGSGILTTTLARLEPQCRFFATDISQEALYVARQNIATHAPNADITLHHCSILPPDMSSFELLISNPPYIRDDYPISKPLRYEPQIALFGGKDGLDVYREILKTIEGRTNIWLLCEMGYDQKEAMGILLQNAKNVEFYKDLSGWDRGFSAYFM
ncbi:MULTISPECIES: peptide chain release factor N(5)-glutamine methyltransferase [Helicobacter]|uniref:peptide chain release factor N(5)-glutamine methyltransferase n=2 Tax=Helicobacter typhlonius TaxID=76936 RepID=A0A099UES7_9HELI|nr:MULTISPECIES: peptide chain release factor N(5)-glutamine methyltransferase [Helicobacter]TLD79161.1 peptide chain release factor N(5)-glutamine methyltransferase [Helicobacter typhlonius]TLD89756.1 peptide chain release factor N(5)-glutamine methyltransferase [Helicobacter sp. MIT 03-1616]CUU40494.1 Protein-N(5)-glutamine methyltransferase PrmC, methylates polypeptide chain release factors RF1 and RF2 [Helicobacter typhlonius]